MSIEKLNPKTAPEIGKFNVCAKQCQNCLFGKNPLVSESRKEEIIAGCLKSDKHFTCHKYTNVCCNGFWRRFSKSVLTTRIALSFDRVEFIR